MAMTLRLSPDDDRLLAELARAEGLSKQETVARAIREAAERRAHREQVRRLSSSGRARYAELLDRLGQ
ncbi:ribbon-helix-helix protein, CopG family [Helcobacillus massiliensis]|uniref:ribbon-helix-helix protein, CopG family n=1 Tax=Helcobacillus TaxID=1161125 RepID=UPI001EF4FB98|nr:MULTISPECIES: ribbon-helix-helix protein, CopG family [Helcobacillus]MCG7427861.1 ribbon-helix-helix protein, CopG family [Helcobacillus sp. ACRRO]MCT1558618.1 ribbon-helix-helix protein, CopG family [Helcobacillus massiliensis]MCT2037315.1 ribbon-helix-helix protein, CopG family [Helcobacillus massiliensis]MCT2332808.1 ribbon-helix-helix protein, CopG family [Helcobacillus massiliensis]MDK7741675.1 ribbon-helix-helix protein, CopG family [Helcobacillus massiliensis]